MPAPQLVRIRWAVRAVLVLGVAASVAANILHARDNPVSQIIAAWPPLALLLTVELISRIPVHRRSLAAVRLLSTAAIAGIAAWVSYWHMVGVAAHYGEDYVSAHALPFSVDGLVVVASVSLVELAGRIRADDVAAVDARTADAQPVHATVDDQPAPVIAAADPIPALEAAVPVRTDAPAADGRRTATVDDARRVARAERKLGRRTISRDALGRLLRERDLSVANERAGELLAAARAELAADDRTAAAAVNGRTPQLQPA